jgi:hypothetical protein
MMLDPENLWVGGALREAVHILNVWIVLLFFRETSDSPGPL